MLYVELWEERRNIVMAWKLLPTDYTDRMWDGLQKYTEIDNGDGTVSFQDVTAYTSKEKSFFGAYDANRMNEALNILMSMVENGTNLYEDFLNYFAAQKQLFEDAANGELDDFNDSLNEKQESAQTNLDAFIAYMKAKEVDADLLMAAFQQYVDDFKAETATVIQDIKYYYQNDMAQYKQSQQTYFDIWFQSMRDQLSQDAAGHLQNEIDDLIGSLIKIKVTVQESMIGKTLTCTNGTDTKEIVVDDTLVCLFKFSEPGYYTLSDNFSGQSQSIKALHYGLYPKEIKIAVIKVHCPLSMAGKKVYMRYLEAESSSSQSTASDDHELAFVGGYVTSEYPKVISQIVDEDGEAVFAVSDLGNWRVYNNYTKEYEIINVEDYTEYNVNMHVASLTVTFSEEYEGNLCTITGNSGTYTKEIPSGGVVSFAIPLFGNVTISNNRTFDTKTIDVEEYTEYTASFGVATVKLTFLKDAFIGHTVTAKYGTYTHTADIDSSKEVEIELKGLASWTVTNTRNDKKVYVNATEYKTYEYEVDDFVYVNDYVGSFVNE